MSSPLFKLLEAFAVRPSPRVVTFTGGMGAQIISAAVYHALRAAGEHVLADLSYFDQAPHIVQAGLPGVISVRPWQLTCFGIAPESFEAVKPVTAAKCQQIADGAQKMSLGVRALRDAQIQAQFVIPPHVNDLLQKGFPESYICVHIRRGDYVNVASHLVEDEQFMTIAQNFSGLVQGAVVVSDSPIPASFRERFAPLFPQVAWMDDLDAFGVHRLMRHARILVCSNSQFSLVAALLNARGLIVLPKQWFGPGNEDLERALSSICDFQILKAISI